MDVQTPNLDRISAVREQAQAIGEFLDWLVQEQNIALCQWQDAGTNGEPPSLYEDRNRRSTDELDAAYGVGKWESLFTDYSRIRIDNPKYESWPEGHYPVSRSINDWLSLYFGIDQDQAEAERRALLERVRAMHRATEGVNDGPG